MSWFDNTGLLRKFGTEKAIVNRGGEYRNVGRLREIEFKIDLTGTNLTVTPSPTILSDQVFVPKNMIIQEVEVDVQTAAAGGTSIALGLIRTDRVTEVDFDGLLTAFPTASMTPVGAKTIVPVGGTGAGVLIGASTGANPTYVTASRVGTFTTGIIVVTIRLWKP